MFLMTLVKLPEVSEQNINIVVIPSDKWHVILDYYIAVVNGFVR